jgi:hypothetical protein
MVRKSINYALVASALMGAPRHCRKDKVDLTTDRQVSMTMLRIMNALALLVLAVFLAADTHAQEIDFDQISKFDSVGRGTLNVGEPPKTIVDDSERHVVILTIWDADAETKVYWKAPDADAPRTTVIPGRGIQTFQTAGLFKLEAVGEPSRQVQYGYVLLGLRK